MTREQVLSIVDHTLLKADATWEQIKVICDEAVKTRPLLSASTPALSKRLCSI